MRSAWSVDKTETEKSHINIEFSPAWTYDNRQLQNEKDKKKKPKKQSQPKSVCIIFCEASQC